jgi:hypothetical protein
MSPSNRLDAGAQLLADTDAWCQRTGTAETAIGRLLFRHPGFIGLLRKRLTVSDEKEAAVRQFLTDNPEGWNGKLPQCHGFGVTRPLRSAKTRLVGGVAAEAGYGQPSARSIQVLRDGLEDAVRKLDGCQRFKLPDGVAEAARTDGRPYTEFLSALMWMGLECWKDDRAGGIR